MARFGQGVNYQLGMRDYSPILQGAQMAAQGQMQGAQAIAQGLANLGQAAGAAVQDYYKKKEQNELLSTTLSSLKKQDKDTSGQVSKYLRIGDPNDDKAWKAAIKGAGGGDINKGVAAVSAFMRDFEGYQQQQADKQAIAIGMSANQAGAGRMSPIDAIRASGGQVSPAVANYFSQMAQNEAQTSKLLAEADALRAKPAKPSGTLMSGEQFKSLVGQGLDVKAVPQQGGGYLVTEVSPFAKPAQTNINTGETMKNTRFKDLSTLRNAEIMPLINQAPAIDAMEALLGATDESGKVITGKLANLELGAKSLLNATGLSNFEDVAATQAYLGNSAALVGQIIKQFGAGTGLSDKDLSFASKAAAGEITMDRQALKQLLDIAKQVRNKKIESFNSDVKQAFSGEGEDDKFAIRSLEIKQGASPFAISTQPSSKPALKPLSPKAAKYLQ